MRRVYSKQKAMKEVDAGIRPSHQRCRVAGNARLIGLLGQPQVRSTRSWDNPRRGCGQYPQGNLAGTTGTSRMA